jgi:hypothetical protein
MNALLDPARGEFHLATPRFPLPVIRGVMDRRILANFRCDPDVLSRHVPPPFRLKLVHGFGLAGICLIRLRRIGPRWWPDSFGFASESAAHRIAVGMGRGRRAARRRIYSPSRHRFPLERTRGRAPLPGRSSPRQLPRLGKPPPLQGRTRQRRRPDPRARRGPDGQGMAWGLGVHFPR